MVCHKRRQRTSAYTCARFFFCTLAVYHIIIMSNYEYELCRDIQDIIGPATYWPRQIRRLFWSFPWSHWERVRLAAFVWINALNPEVFYDWAELKHFFSRGSAVHRHFEQLFSYFRQGVRYRLHTRHWRSLLQSSGGVSSSAMHA